SVPRLGRRFVFVCSRVSHFLPQSLDLTLQLDNLGVILRIASLQGNQDAFHAGDLLLQGLGMGIVSSLGGFPCRYLLSEQRFGVRLISLRSIEGLGDRIKLGIQATE